jgi:hypothetical protein
MGLLYEAASQVGELYDQLNCRPPERRMPQQLVFGQPSVLDLGNELRTNPHRTGLANAGHRWLVDPHLFKPLSQILNKPLSIAAVTTFT